MKISFAAISLLLLLSACAEPLPPVNLDYSSLGKVGLSAADFKITDRSNFKPVDKSFLNDVFQPKLNDVVSQWAVSRFQASGSSGRANLVINDAMLTKQVLPLKRGLVDFYVRQQDVKYVGRVEVRLEVQQPNGSSGVATAYAVYSTTVPESPSDQERQIAYRKIIDNIIPILNKNMDEAIAQRFPADLISGVSAVSAPSGADYVAPSPALSAAPTGAYDAAPLSIKGSGGSDVGVSAPAVGSKKKVNFGSK